MKREDLHNRLNELTDKELLQAITINKLDYATEAQDEIKGILEERGITEKGVLSFCDALVDEFIFTVKCASCRESLNLETEDIFNGVFECPDCKIKQVIKQENIKVFQKRNRDAPEAKANSVLCDEITFNSTEKKRDLNGLSGWLVLVGVGLVLSAFRLVFAFFESLSNPDSTGSVLALIDLGIVAYLIYLFGAKKSLFPGFMIAYLALGAFLSFGAYMAESNEPTYGFERTSEGGGAAVVAAILSAAIWIPYFLRSRRVQQTFTEVTRWKADRKQPEMEDNILQNVQSNSNMKTETSPARYPRIFKGVIRYAFHLMRIATSVLLFIALAPQDSNYYLTLRWVVCIVSTVTAIWSGYLVKLNTLKEYWPWLFGGIAVVFNPFVPVYLSRRTWSIIDLSVAIIFLVSLITLRIRNR